MRGMTAARQSRPPPPPEVMTIDDLAAYLQVSKSSLYKLAQDGKVPGQKVGKHWRFSRMVIDGWLRGQRVEHIPRRAGTGKQRRKS
jgi:excisionase family DNA binding protein